MGWVLLEVKEFGEECIFDGELEIPDEVEFTGEHELEAEFEVVVQTGFVVTSVNKYEH